MPSKGENLIPIGSQTPRRNWRLLKSKVALWCDQAGFETQPVEVGRSAAPAEERERRRHRTPPVRHEEVRVVEVDVEDRRVDAADRRPRRHPERVRAREL